MKEFLAGFQVDTENKELAGVCAGLGNYFNIKINVIRLVAILLFLSSTEFGILTVILYAYLACLSSGLAWERSFRRRGEKSKKSSYSLVCCLFDFSITWNRGFDSNL